MRRDVARELHDRHRTDRHRSSLPGRAFVQRLAADNGGVKQAGNIEQLSLGVYDAVRHLRRALAPAPTNDLTLAQAIRSHCCAKWAGESRGVQSPRLAKIDETALSESQRVTLLRLSGRAEYLS